MKIDVPPSLLKPAKKNANAKKKLAKR